MINYVKRIFACFYCSVHKTCSFTQELQDVPNDDLKAESEVLPAKEVAVDGHTKSD